MKNSRGHLSVRNNQSIKIPRLCWRALRIGELKEAHKQIGGVVGVAASGHLRPEASARRHVATVLDIGGVGLGGPWSGAVLVAAMVVVATRGITGVVGVAGGVVQRCAMPFK